MAIKIHKMILNTGIYTMGNFLPQAIGFILLPIYTKFLTPAQYGIIGSMQVLQYFFALLFTLSLEKSVIRLYWNYEDEEDRKSFLGTLNIVVILTAVFFSAIFYLLHKYVNLIFLSIPFYPYYLYAILNSLFIAISVIPLNYLILKEKPRVYFYITTFQLVLSTSLILYFVVIQRQEAEGLMLGKMLASMIIIPAFIYIAKKGFSYKFNMRALKDAAAFSFPIIPTMIISWVLNQSDRIMIEKYFSLASVGIYALSRQISNLIALLSTAFAMAYGPIFFRLVNSNEKDKENNINKIYKINNLFISIMMLIFFTVSLICKDLILLFLNHRYYEAYYFIPIISFAYFVNSITAVILGYYFQQSKRMKENMYIALVVSLFYIGLSLPFIKYLGLLGASLLLIISSISIFTASYIYTKKHCFFINFDWKSNITVLILFIMTIILFVYLISQTSLILFGLKLLIIIFYVITLLKRQIKLSTVFQYSSI